jgi:hypothetical protein
MAESNDIPDDVAYAIIGPEPGETLHNMMTSTKRNGAV